MPEIHKKKCVSCLKQFESPGSKNCPHCGSDAWVFVHEDGRAFNPIRAAQRRKAAEEARHHANLDRLYPDFVCSRS